MQGCGLGSHHVFYSALGRSLQEKVVCFICYISMYFNIFLLCLLNFNGLPKGVEGQEAGCPGQVEEGHGEGGGRQQLVDQRQQEITRP